MQTIFEANQGAVEFTEKMLQQLFRSIYGFVAIAKLAEEN
jgi:hypothetical protein